MGTGGRLPAIRASPAGPGPARCPPASPRLIRSSEAMNTPFNTLFPKLFLVALAGLPAAVLAHGDAVTGAHGGTLIESGEVVLEWIGARNTICLSDHGSGAPIPSAQAGGRIIVAGAGAQELTPADGNCLRYPTALAAGSKAVVSIRLPGRPPVQARLEP